MSPQSVHTVAWDVLRCAFVALTLAYAVLCIGVGANSARASSDGDGLTEATISSSFITNIASPHHDAQNETSHSPGDCLHGQCAHSTALTTTVPVLMLRDFAAAKISLFQQGAPDGRAPLPPARPPRA